MSALLHTFRVRLFNIRASGLSASPRAVPPYIVRGNFDGRAFNTEAYRGGGGGSAVWAFDMSFEYAAPALDGLAARWVVMECYGGGGDVFLGMARADLRTIATGPSVLRLSLHDGRTNNGTLQMDVSMALVCDVGITFSNVGIRDIGGRGEMELNPYLTLTVPGGPVVESSVAAKATSPFWGRLPTIHYRGTFDGLRQLRLPMHLKHSRNGYTAGVHDATMAAFDVDVSAMSLRAGGDVAVPMRRMVHAEATFPLPFSAEFTATVEFSNVHRVAQIDGAILTDDGIIGTPKDEGWRWGTSAETSAPGRSAPLLPTESPRRSPPRGRGSPTLPRTAERRVAGADVEVLEDVSARQNDLLAKLRVRLDDVVRRRSEVQQQITTMKTTQVAEAEAAEQRRAGLEVELRNALAERERLSEALRRVHARREEALSLSQRQAGDRERAKRVLQAEQEEALALQQRVAGLRDEMLRHLEEEEHRYQRRVRDAEDARRRTIEDADALSALEARLAEAETRVVQRSSTIRRTTVRQS